MALVALSLAKKTNDSGPLGNNSGALLPSHVLWPPKSDNLNPERAWAPTRRAAFGLFPVFSFFVCCSAFLLLLLFTPSFFLFVSFFLHLPSFIGAFSFRPFSLPPYLPTRLIRHEISHPLAGRRWRCPRQWLGCHGYHYMGW